VKLTTYIDPVPRLRIRGVIPPLPQYDFMTWCLVKHRRYSVSIVARIRAGRPGFDFQQGQRTFLFATASRLAVRLTQPPIKWVPGPLSSGIKWPGLKMTTHFYLALTLRMCGRSYISTPSYILMAWCLVKHRDNFIQTQAQNVITTTIYYIFTV